MSASFSLSRLRKDHGGSLKRCLFIIAITVMISAPSAERASAADAIPVQISSPKNIDENKLKARIGRAKNSGDKNAEAEALEALAHFYCNSGNKPEKAIPLYQEALRRLDELEDQKELEYKCCSSLGDIFYGKEKYAEAELLYTRALNCAIAAGLEENILARAGRDLGNALLSQQKNTAALSAFEQALAAAEKEKDEELISDTKLGIANSRWNEGEYAKARSIYELLLAASIKEDGPASATSLARTKDVADCNYEEGLSQKALDGYKSFLAIASKVAEADKEQIEEAKTRIDELCDRLGLPTEKDRRQAEETRKQIDKAYAWLPYALGGSLLALIILYLLGRRNPDSAPDSAASREAKTVETQ